MGQHGLSIDVELSHRYTRGFRTMDLNREWTYVLYKEENIKITVLPLLQGPTFNFT